MDSELQLKALGYLQYLDSNLANTASQAWGIPLQNSTLMDINTPDLVVDAILTLRECNVWLGVIFDNKELWWKYLSSVSTPTSLDGLNYVLWYGTHDDLLSFFRAMYRFGTPAISDAEFDVIEQLYAQTFENITPPEQITPDDTNYSQCVLDALAFARVKSTRTSGAKVSKLEGVAASLNSEKSTSVKPVRSYEEVYDYLKNSPVVRTHWSLKMDGFNTKVLFKEDGTGIEVALSRGRASDSWDYTEALRNVFSIKGYDVSKLHGKVTGESMVDPKSMEYFRTKYPDKDYKSPKSMAGALLRAPQNFDISDYEHLRFFPFGIDDVQKDEAFQLFTDCGLDVPPSLIVEAGAIPLQDFELFKQWLDSMILDPIWEQAEQRGIGSHGSDGVVLQLLTSIENDRADKYSDLNIALKFSHWGEQEYESKVTDIIFEQRRVEMSVILVIEPVTTRDFNVATRVSVGSTAILVNDNVRIGDAIRFARKSEAINVYLGKR